MAQSQNGLYRLVSRPRRLRFGFAVQSAEMPFSVAVAQSVTAAAAASGVELLMLDNRYDADAAIQNAEEFVAKRVDLVLEFQVEEEVAPRVAHIFNKADIPLVAIDVPHPNSTYFGVDNFEVGYEAGSLLAQHAQRKWKGKVRSGPRRRLQGGRQLCAEPHHRRLRRNSRAPPRVAADRFVQIEGRGMREPSQMAMKELSPRTSQRRAHPGGRRQLIPALWAFWMPPGNWVCEQDFAIAGQDCIPEVLEEMRSGKSALIGSISPRSRNLRSTAHPTRALLFCAATPCRPTTTSATARSRRRRLPRN